MLRSDLSPEFRDIARHYRPVEPWDSRAWKRLSATFVIAMVWGGLAAGVVLEWLAKRGKR